jgi:hypothetical protein
VEDVTIIERVETTGLTYRLSSNIQAKIIPILALAFPLICKLMHASNVHFLLPNSTSLSVFSGFTCLEVPQKSNSNRVAQTSNHEKDIKRKCEPGGG